jgi:ankyrin repeat protein
MMSSKLPEKPNLEHLKKQAKELLRDFQQGDTAAADRFRAQNVRPSGGPSLKLADAQHVIAHEYGFTSWPRLKEHVESLTRTQTPAEKLAAAVCASDSARTARVLHDHPELAAQLNDPMVNYGGMQALLAAVQRTDRNTIDVLLESGADINTRSHHWAGGIGVLDECLPELAPFLIERGARLNAHSAARLGMLDRLQEFVAADPGVAGARGWNGQMPLHLASTVEIAQYLLEHGADIDARDLQHESTPAQHMLRVVQARHFPRDRQDVARYLVARGCRTDILMAAALGDMDLVRRHLDSDPDTIRVRVSEEYFPKQDPRSGGTIYNYSFGRMRTPHLIARDFGHDDVFKFLMDRSPEDVKLAQALDLGDEGIFRTWLARRPDPIRTLSDDDRRRLPDAAQNNNTVAVKLMLEAGWPVDTRGEYNMTSLQWGAWHGNAEMVREILGHQPEIELQDSDHNITALGCALHGSENGWHRDSGDYVATVEALMDSGAKAPKVTPDLEASPDVREFLEEREQGPQR